MASTVTNAKDFRNKRKPYTFQASDELTVLVKRVDMISLMVTGAVPMPLMNAADKFEKVRDEINEDTTPEEAMQKLQEAGDDGEFRKFLEAYAAYLVIEPKIFVPKHPQTYADCPETSIPADEIGLMELLAIWNAHPEDEKPAPEVTAPVTFRDGTAEPADSVASDGESVREVPKLVDGSKDEFIYS